MNYEKLKEQWVKEENAAFQGWDFSRLDGRWDCPEPPWNYQSIVKSYLKDDDMLLDMGTGGGEVLLSINHPYGNTYATEAYEPNFELCQRVLSPLGITVVQTYNDDRLDKLPFEGEYFDFIINRHESFDLSEVNRTLKHGGYFFTQQVGNKNDLEFIQIFNKEHNLYSWHTIDNYADTLVKLGYQIIIKDEARFPVKFFDIGALVYFAKIIVWEFPDFSVEKCFDTLCECQREIEKHGFLEGTGHGFILGARKL